MRMVGWPKEPDGNGCIFPVSIVDVDFHGNAEELRAVSAFLLRAAADMDMAEANNAAVHIGIELGNSKQPADVGIWINVVRHVDE